MGRERKGLGEMKDYSQTSREEVLRLFATDPEKGLSTSIVAARRNEHGRNELKEKRRQTVWEMVFSQFREFLILLLLGAALISLLLGEVTDAAVIFLIVFINAIFGVVQEFKAEKALEALRSEEHTSELQSRPHLVCRLLLE